MLSAQEEQRVEILYNQLQSIQSTTRALQGADLTFSESRFLLNELIKDFPILEEKIGCNSSIVSNKIFESAIDKIQRKMESQLTLEERQVMRPFENDDEVVENLLQGEVEEDLDFAETALKRFKSQHLEVKNYVDLSHLLPTSNVCEQFFSIAGRALTKHRQSIEPMGLEAQLFLKMNKKFWDLNTVMEIVNAVGEEK
jgi:hypothetical protein